ncbi:hypothetical protein PENSPDRAFT_694236 [Peniophora sp. CONT]|nr:hypothetical protein PENSPDRAFT_694236 [Peniophora sp. CONT]
MSTYECNTCGATLYLHFHLHRDAIPPPCVLPYLLLKPSRPRREEEPCLLYHLPSELIIKILKEVVQTQKNPITTLLLLAQVNHSFAREVHGASELWADAFKYARSVSQRYIVSQLAGGRLLPYSSRHRLEEVIPYIHRFGEITFDSIWGIEEWIELLNTKDPESLYSLKTTPHVKILTLQAKLRSLTAAGPTRLNNPGELRILRLESGFGRGATADTFKELLSRCPLLSELRIADFSRYAMKDDAYCWQEILKPLSNSGLRELCLEHFDGKFALEAAGHEALHFPYLHTLATRSALIVNAPQLLHADVSPQDFYDWSIMAPHLSNVHHLEITMRNCNHHTPSEPFSETHGGDLTFPHLGALKCRSTVDSNLLRFLGATTFLAEPTLDLLVQIPSSLHNVHDPDAAFHSHNLFAVNTFKARSHIGTLKDLSAIIAQSSSPGAKISLGPDDMLGGETSFVYSIVNEEAHPLVPGTQRPRFKDVRLRMSLDSSWSADPDRHDYARQGFPATPIYALSAFAIENATKLRISLHPDLPSNIERSERGWGIDSNQRAQVGAWTSPDALAAPDTFDFELLCDTLSALSNVLDLEIDIDRSTEVCGVGLLKAVIAKHTKELKKLELGESVAVTCAQLKTITFIALETGVAYRDAFVEQVKDFATARSRLAKRGLCAIPRVSTSQQFCTCRMSDRDKTSVAGLRLLGMDISIPERHDHRQCCT